MAVTWNCQKFVTSRSLIFRGNVNDVNDFRILECCRETCALPGRNYSPFKYVISMYFHVSTLTPLCAGIHRHSFLHPYTPISYRSLRSLSPGATPADAMTNLLVLSLSPHITFSIRPQEDKEMPPARAAQALLTLPPPPPGVLIPTNPWKARQRGFYSLSFFLQVVQQPLLCIYLTHQRVVHTPVDRILCHNHVNLYGLFLTATRQPLVRLLPRLGRPRQG